MREIVIRKLGRPASQDQVMVEVKDQPKGMSKDGELLLIGGLL